MRIVCTVVIAVLAAGGARGQGVRSESFALAPAWTLSGSGTNGNSFGYQSSSFAGGMSGEGGGTFTRSPFERVYADTAIGTLSLATPLAASGQLLIRNASDADLGSGLVLGHFNSTSQASIGLFFNQDLTTTDGVYLDLILRTGAGVTRQTRLITSPDPLQSRDWSYAWDPAGGTLGGGRLSATVGGSDGGSGFIDLTAGEAAAMPGLTGFGFYAAATDPLSGNPSQPTWSLQVYGDNFSYSVVPEPVCGIAGVVLLGVCVRRRWR